MPWPFDLPGPAFLAFYAVFAIAVIVAAAWARRTLERGAPPRIDLADPYLIACLRGGPAEAARTALLSLVDRGFVEYRDDRFHAREGADEGLLRRPLERAVLRYTGGPTGASGPGVATALAVLREIAPYEDSLRAKGLVRGGAWTGVRIGVAAAAAGILGGVGVAKMAIGVSRGKPIGFLVVLTLVATGAAVAVAVLPRLTGLGHVVLEDARRLYGKVLLKARTLAPGGRNAEAAILIATYGAEVLQGAAWKAIVRKSSPVPPGAQGGGGSCGSTSSCGSSCGGGGGCGGCGGS